MNYNTAKLRQFIKQFFNAEELTGFLFDYFATVSDDVTPTMPKSQQIQMLLDYCARHSKMPDLLTALHRERPNSFSPDDYVQGQKAPTAAPQPPAPITRNPRQVFISHAHQDAEVAQRLAHDLAAHGYDIWIAPDSIQPGEKWVEAMNRGLEESGIRATTTAGQFSPRGDSVYGCVDMAGNVWEWTASKWLPGSGRRALRGGSWNYDQRFARVGSRNHFDPGDPGRASRDIGFRLVSGGFVLAFR